MTCTLLDFTARETTLFLFVLLAAPNVFNAMSFALRPSPTKQLSQKVANMQPIN
jgi:hypothetical protein